MTFLTDSQPWLCSKHVLKIRANLSLNVLIKNVLIKKIECIKFQSKHFSGKGHKSPGLGIEAEHCMWLACSLMSDKGDAFVM